MENIFELYYQTSGICTDSRNIQIGSMFICLKGSNFDGNTFAKKALEDGAKYAIIDDEKYVIDERTVLVKNSLEFLQKLANYHRRKFSIPIIGITGSNGKTSTKELINAVLSTTYNVLATRGNLNNHIGVPLTLLNLNKHHEIAIIEMGANKFNDIEELSTIAEPTHGIITNIGKAHLEGFGGFEGVLKTKKELYEAISKVKGTIVYNHDDTILTNNLPQYVTLFTYGTSASSNILGTLTELNPFVTFQWTHEAYESPKIITKMVGKYNFYNYLAAISFGKLFNVQNQQINKALTSYEPVNNRSQVSKTESNTLILDCYNANPTSMQSALESFQLIDHANKLFIIGDMLELGTESLNEHRNILTLTESLGLHGYTVGPQFRELKSTHIIAQFETINDAIDYFKVNKPKENLVLLKGSRGIGLEVLAEIL
jgi:UDP-N-acetylmuramoyl-tripeptide--D-alanyl-D-alanine ligase